MTCGQFCSSTSLDEHRNGHESEIPEEDSQKQVPIESSEGETVDEHELTGVKEKCEKCDFVHHVPAMMRNHVWSVHHVLAPDQFKVAIQWP